MELSTVIQLASGAALGVLGDRLTLRREARNDQIALAREAAARLLPELRRLRNLARDSRHDELHPRAWAEAITGFTRAYDDFGHRLPDGWRHVHRSVRAAVGEFAGGVVDADLDKRMVDYPLPARDYTWLNNAIDYLEYVVWMLQVWNDTPLSRQVRRRQPLAFDPWLAMRSGTQPLILGKCVDGGSRSVDSSTTPQAGPVAQDDSAVFLHGRASSRRHAAADDRV